MVTRRQEIIRGAILLAAFVLAFVYMSMCQAAGFDRKTKAILDETDSLRVVVRIRDSLSIAHENRADRATAQKLIAQDRAQEAIAEADRLRAQRLRVLPVASQPGAASTASDTLRAMESALENCDQETIALRRAITQDSIALKQSALSEAELRGALAIERQSVADLTGVNQKLSTQLEAADPPCRVAFFPCPSRKTVFIVGIGLGAGITWSLTR
jgi:hypothetical protein